MEEACGGAATDRGPTSIVSDVYDEFEFVSAGLLVIDYSAIFGLV